MLNTPVPRDLTYNWFALAVTGGRKIIGTAVDGSSSLSTLLISPTPAILGDTIVSPSATLTPTLTPTPVASSSPTVTPTMTPVPIPTPTPAVPTPTPSGQTVTVLPNELGFVRVRDGPSVDAVEIGQISSGVTVPYDNVLYDWYHVTYTSSIGWVSGTYIQINP
jgi:hypothetical protein